MRVMFEVDFRGRIPVTPVVPQGGRAAIAAMQPSPNRFRGPSERAITRAAEVQQGLDIAKGGHGAARLCPPYELLFIIAIDAAIRRCSPV